METVSLRELQLFELEMLKDIKHVCEENKQSENSDVSRSDGKGELSVFHGFAS